MGSGYESTDEFFAERGGCADDLVGLVGEFHEGQAVFVVEYVKSTGDVYARRIVDPAFPSFVGDVELLAERIADVETVRSALWLDETDDEDSLFIRRENADEATTLAWARKRLSTGGRIEIPERGPARPAGL